MLFHDMLSRDSPGNITPSDGGICESPQPSIWLYEQTGGWVGQGVEAEQRCETWGTYSSEMLKLPASAGWIWS